jgi:hypothetical protein
MKDAMPTPASIGSSAAPAAGTKTLISSHPVGHRP